MDSTPSFVNLLNSQYDSESPIIEIGSSEVLEFSTQSTDDPSVDVKERKERRKWTPKEDVILISAWLNTSKDPLVGNEQKAAAFWKRIQSYFNSSPQLVGMQPREVSHCKARWGRLNDQVCKFVGCYEAALKEQSSGQNEDDVMKAAYTIFQSDHNVKFTLDHAWRELRHDQKWCAISQAKDGGGKPKRRKVSHGSAQSSSSQPVSHGEDEAMGRPLGVKSAKAKAKMSGKKQIRVEEDEKDLAVLQSMWDIKKQDLEMKEKLSQNKLLFSKNKLLDSLLAKSEPLSDVEMALKNKLIIDMLS